MHEGALRRAFVFAHLQSLAHIYRGLLDCAVQKTPIFVDLLRQGRVMLALLLSKHAISPAAAVVVYVTDKRHGRSGHLSGASSILHHSKHALRILQLLHLTRVKCLK